eukprot:gene27714-7358_t
MVVISRPGDEIVGGGKNANYIKETKELILGNKGIEKIRGFEEFTSLESLWLYGNKLKKINNLDVNFRIRTLHVQDNQICTLKGSLSSFKFLETLDIANNQLRDLEKLLKSLEKFKFLKHLNLKGNPCCEEPDYRLLVIHAMPGLKVLDQHVIATAEQVKAKGLIGGDIATLTVAFGKRTPELPASYFVPNPPQSRIERELVQEAAWVSDKRTIERGEAELAMFSYNPHPDIPRNGSLPPNAGTKRAMETWHTQTLDASRDMSLSMGPSPFADTGISNRTLGSASQPSSSNSSYVAKDHLVLYSCTPSQNQELLFAGTKTTQPGPGSVYFDAKGYKRFVDLKSTGTLGVWDMRKNEVRI